jgi:hypothetical protein
VACSAADPYADSRRIPGDIVTIRPTRREVLAAAGLLGVGAGGGLLASRSAARRGSRAGAGGPSSGGRASGPTGTSPGTTPPGVESSTPVPAGAPPPSLLAAYAAEHDMVARYEDILRDRTAGELGPVLADHRRHLDAFAAAILAVDPSWTPAPPSTAAAAATAGSTAGATAGGTATAGPASPSPSPSPSPPSPSTLASLEQSASAGMLARVAAVDGDLAGLFASVAASEAGHAQVVGALRRAAGS